jgi:hypothetical protein
MILSVFGANKKLFHKILIWKKLIENMNIGDILPIMIYDDMCYLCTKFAKVVSVLTGKKILVVGHYSKYGMEIKSEIFPKDYDPTKMFWFVTRKVAYGGRSAILPLLHAILSNKSKGRFPYDISTTCSSDCKTPKAVFARTKSLLSNSEKIILNF